MRTYDAEDIEVRGCTFRCQQIGGPVDGEAELAG